MGAGAGGWGGGWVLLGSTGLVLPAAAQSPARLNKSKGQRPLPPTPKKQIAFEFKFTVKLKLEFDFDFDLISGSNFNKMGIKVVQISTYHFQI